MATYFARRIPMEGHLVSARLPSPCRVEARDLPAHCRTCFLASRSLLAELMLILYGTDTLPEIVTQAKDRPAFRDKNLPDFSISCVGSIVGVVLTAKGACGLDTEPQRAIRGFYNPNSAETWRFSSNENLWINNQNNLNEMRAQLITLRQNILKLAGGVCNNDPREFQFLPGAGCLKCTHVAQVEAIYDAEDVLMWSVTATPTIEELKVWESDDKQDWEGLPNIQTRANEPTDCLIRSS